MGGGITADRDDTLGLVLTVTQEDLKSLSGIIRHEDWRNHRQMSLSGGFWSCSANRGYQGWPVESSDLGSSMPKPFSDDMQGVKRAISCHNSERTLVRGGLWSYQDIVMWLTCNNSIGRDIILALAASAGWNVCVAALDGRFVDEPAIVSVVLGDIVCLPTYLKQPEAIRRCTCGGW